MPIFRKKKSASASLSSQQRANLEKIKSLLSRVDAERNTDGKIDCKHFTTDSEFHTAVTKEMILLKREELSSLMGTKELKAMFSLSAELALMQKECKPKGRLTPPKSASKQRNLTPLSARTRTMQMYLPPTSVSMEREGGGGGAAREPSPTNTNSETHLLFLKLNGKNSLEISRDDDLFRELSEVYTIHIDQKVKEDNPLTEEEKIIQKTFLDIHTSTDKVPAKITQAEINKMLETTTFGIKKNMKKTKKTKKAKKAKKPNKKKSKGRKH